MVLKILPIVVVLAILTPCVGQGITVRVRSTEGGPRIFVDGKPVRHRFVYGNPALLAAISEKRATTFTLPFHADVDTDEACVTLAGKKGDEPFWFSNQLLVDMTDGTTNRLGGAEEVRTLTLVVPRIRLKKGHDYRFIVTDRAVHDRQFFTHSVSYPGVDGQKVELPLPYGDALFDTVAMAAGADVNLVTFGVPNSYGCDACWHPPEEPDDFSALDHECERLLKANPNALLVPRVNADAPQWMLDRDHSLKMKFAKGFTIDAPSLSARSYRMAVCAHFEKLARHLVARFPNNFAGLHIGGQNSAEWFYHLSQSHGDLSGYDVHTLTAFRAYLSALGEPDADKAEVPSAAERSEVFPRGLRDPVRHRRLLQFAQFRQLEVAKLISELGAAVRRGSEGKCMALFFYGYSWELGCGWNGPSETGHYALQWLLENGRENIDGLSAPFSYSCRKFPGSSPVMSPAETIMRSGILWINEDDTRTYKEDIWCYKALGGGRHDTLRETADTLMRNACIGILRGYGEWWMDLFGRGWYRSPELWELRKKLNPLDDALMRRKKPYSPPMAVVVDEKSFLRYGSKSGCHLYPLLNHEPMDMCGVPYGQYFLDDILDRPIDARLVYLCVAQGLTAEQRAKIVRYKKSRPETLFVENVTAADMTVEAIAEKARIAGIRPYTRPGVANVNAAEGYVSVFSHIDGPVEMDFGREGRIVDYMTGKLVGNGQKLTTVFRQGETKVYFLESASN